ncbi:MAG: HAD family hydrolase [Thermaerobacterales bacterium]
MTDQTFRPQVDCIVSDVEGCIVPVARGRWDLPAVSRLAAYVEQAAAGRVPPLVLCSGRPAQFVEALGAALGLKLPSICENGGVLFDPAQGGEIPLYSAAQGTLMHEARRRLAADLGAAARIAAGKAICLSIVLPAGRRAAMEDLHRRVRSILAADEALSENLVTTLSPSAVDIMPSGIDKGTGILKLLDRLGVRPERAAAIGDGGNDLSMMNRVGLACAPANAMPEVLAAADLKAREPEARGVLEILNRLTFFASLTS